MSDPDNVKFVQVSPSHRCPVWHGTQYFSWPVLFAAMRPGDRAVASVRNPRPMARRAGRRIQTRKRADGLLEIHCVE